jgi:hypothetical protein
MDRLHPLVWSRFIRRDCPRVCESSSLQCSHLCQSDISCLVDFIGQPQIHNAYAELRTNARLCGNGCVSYYDFLNTAARSTSNSSTAQ